MEIKLYKPAARFGEAVPIGNGQIGAMVYGSFPIQKVVLSENTFFSGEKSQEHYQKGAAEAFEKMREQAKKGLLKEVKRTAKDFIGIRGEYGTNLPVGELLVYYENQKSTNCLCERALNLETGTATLRTFLEEQEIKETIFASHPDKILVYHIVSEKRMDKVKISFGPYEGNGIVEYEPTGFTFEARAEEKMHCGKLCGVCLYGACLAITDGICRAAGDGLEISDALEITFYMTMATDYENRMQEQPLEKENIGNILKELIKDRLETALSKGWKAIWEVHKRDVQKLFEASSLHIETKDGQELENLDFLYQYGRYLLFSSSREDSVLPAHLQGIWNDNVACRIGWTCDMHLDINTQMNYWPSELTGLSETASPLFRWVKALAKEGELTAKKCYGQKGWVAELVSNSWLFTAPYWAEPIAPCPTGGVWVLSHLWEHYFYTGDEEFLKMEVYPLMKGAVSFFLNYLFENEEGYLVGGPSISPENSFVFDGEILQISNGCTYEILMIRELFEKYCQVCEILKETEMVTEVKNVLQRLLPYRISEDGSLAEWEKDYKEADVQHRHTSHLLGLFPFAQITRDKTPELIPAVEKVLEKKQNPPENWEDTGWARSMLMLYEARLGHGEKAWQHILSMMERLQEPNHMIYHPPTRGAGAFDHVYELDGNTGLTTCVAEMLLQSQEQVIQLLPAVPKEWYRGQVKGLHARGGIEVGFSWESGRVQNCSLKAKRDCCVRIRANDREWEVSLKGGEIYNFT